MMTLDELRKRQGSGEDDGSDNEDQSFYAGGEKSGMAVMGGAPGGGNPLVDQIMAKARAQQQQEGSQSVFAGRAKKLTDEDDQDHGNDHDDNDDLDPPVIRTMTFWSDGFTLEPSPTLRSFTDAHSLALLASIRSGSAPTAELGLAPGQAVEMRVVQREGERFEEGRQREVWREVERARGKERRGLKAFGGPGRRLGDVPDAPQAPSQSKQNVARDESAGFRAGQPSTRIQLRLSNGTRHTIQFNLEQSIEDLYATARQLNGGRAVDQLLTGRPPVPIPSELKMSIREAQLEGSLLIQQ